MITVTYTCDKCLGLGQEPIPRDDNYNAVRSQNKLK